MRQIKILHLLSSGKRVGGTELMTCQLVTHINRKCFHADLAFLDDGGPAAKRARAEGLEPLLLGLKPHNPLPGIKKLIQVLGQYDVLHLYGFKASLVGRVVGSVFRQLIVVDGLRGQRPWQKDSRSRFWLDRLTFPLSRGYIANSNRARSFLIAKGYNPNKCWVIPNGLDFQRFQALAGLAETESFRSNINSEVHPIITCVANLRPVKGHIYLLRALNKLHEYGKEFHCLILGVGPELTRLQKFTGEHDLSEQVTFMGYRSDIPAVLASSDVFVLSSLAEGMPVSILEAMAAGLPIVATAVGGIPEVIIDGETGFLVPPKNAGALASKLIELLENDVLSRHVGQQAQVRLQAKFTIERMTSAYEDLYSKLVLKRDEHVSRVINQ